MARETTQGICHLCKGTFPKGSMTRHLSKCLTTRDDAEKSGDSKAKTGKLFHVVVEARGDPRYWLHLELPATAKLKHLDSVLRKLWLECCGHLSAFKLEGQKKRAMPRSMAELLASGFDPESDPDEL